MAGGNLANAHTEEPGNFREQPASRTRSIADAKLFALLCAAAFQPWTFGFQGRPSNGHTGLATLYDLSGDYNFKHGLSLGLYFGYAVGGPVIKAIYPKDSNGALGVYGVQLPLLGPSKWRFWGLR